MSPTRILIAFDNPVREYVSRILSGASRAGSSAGFRVEAENAHENGKRIEAMIDDPSVAGVIVTPPYTDDRHVLGMVEAKRLPLVRIAPMLDPDRGSTVTMDEYDAARAVTDHILEQGHRRVAIMRGPRTHLVSMRRYNGYAAALGGKGLKVDPGLVAQGDFSRESGRVQAGLLFAAKPSAIFASNDEMALGIIDAANAAGIAIPNDISLVGFDDNNSAKTSRPRLTTVRQPLEEMGEAAVNLLVERIRNPARGPSHATVPYAIVVRESVAAPAA